MHFKKRKTEREKENREVHSFLLPNWMQCGQLSHDPTCLPIHDQLYPQNEQKENPFLKKKVVTIADVLDYMIEHRRLRQL